MRDVPRGPVPLAPPRSQAASGTAELFRGEAEPRPKKQAKGPDPAAAIVEAYHRLIGSANTCPGEVGPVRVLLNAGVLPETLLKAVEGYGAYCKKERTPAKFRLAAMTFFGKAEAMWKVFAGDEWNEYQR